MFLTKISLKRPVFATVIIIALVALGFVSYQSLPIDQFPDIDVPYVSITALQIGAAPDQIETNITKPVEDAVGQISGVKHIYSTVQENVSNTTIEFEMEKPADEAMQEVRDKLSAIRGSLPRDMDEPIVARYDMSATAIMSLAVAGELSNAELSQLVDDSVVDRINTVKGVGAVNTFGNQEREIQIELDKQKMNALSITPSEVIASLGGDNINLSSGKVTGEETEISLKTKSSVKEVSDFLDVLVAKRGGSEVRIRDIAEVTDGIEEQDTLSFLNGKPTIGIDVIKQSGANTVEVAEGISTELAKIEEALPEGVTLQVVRDNSVSIRDSVHDVQKTIIEGCILAVVIVLVFLKDFKSTIISALSLPISLVTTFLVMNMLDFSLNMVSLMALSLSVGLLIDDAIVVLENIVRHLNGGKMPNDAAEEGTNEIGLAVMATTFAVVAVFVPLAMTSGMIGKFLVQFGITVAVSVVVSLFVSFTLVPLLSARYMDKEEKRIPILGILLDAFHKLLDIFTAGYAKLLDFSLRHTLLVLVIPIALFVGTISMVQYLDVSLMSTSDVGEIQVDAELDAGTTLNAASGIREQIEAKVNEFPQVQFLYSTVTTDKVSIFVKTTEKQERTETITEIADEMRAKLTDIPETKISVLVSGGMSEGKAIQYHIQGQDFAQLEEYAKKAEAVLLETPGAVDVGLTYKAGKPELGLAVDRDKAADLGVSPAVVSSTLGALFQGAVVTQYETDADKYDVRIHLQDTDRKDLDSLSGIYVPSTSGTMVSLDQVTQKVFRTSASTINRYDKSREIQLTGNFSGVSQTELSSSFESRLAEEAPLPDGVRMNTGGMQEMMEESFQSLFTALFMGILFIFLVLAAQFESFIDPMAILFSLPLAIIGAIWGLLLGHKELNMMAMIGVIMLMGLVVKNAILLIDFAKQRYEESGDMHTALVEAGRIRLRPILMTTLAMIFGMIPAAIATGSGSEMRAPMAYAIIGGLIVSTLLTLFVVPIIYLLLDKMKKLGRRIRRKEEAPALLAAAEAKNK